MITVEQITYLYPHSDTPIFQDFSAHFKRGEIVAVSGKNGSGKTTLSKLLAGILQPQKGSVCIDGLSTKSQDLFEIGQKVGYLFQNPNRQLFCETVFREITFGLNNQGLKKQQATEKADYYLNYFNLASYRDDYPGHLSHGEKQRLALAAVLALGTDYVVLDEPTIGLDMLRRRELGELLLKLCKESNCGIVLICQEAEFMARYAERELVIPV
ncbi:MAG: energy-coupling factor ABC transporter ATP-binding protein [Firmicutes bacterium]|nr:energy-coupling factor ABC transporter ATP-binding protein [Bacillota bacterium]